jgi:hypothetical protein
LAGLSIVLTDVNSGVPGIPITTYRDNHFLRPLAQAVMQRSLQHWPRYRPR